MPPKRASVARRAVCSSASDSSGSGGPINIMASPVTFVLTAFAGVIAGISVGIFAAVLLTMSPHDSTGPGLAAEKPATSGTAG